MKSSLLSRFKDTCKRKNLKVTPQREALYRLILDAKEHPSANVIHRRVKKIFPNISLDTVNRTLLTFTEIGLIDIVESFGGPKRYDANRDDHHHFHCLRCGSISDVQNQDGDRIILPDDIRKKNIILSQRVVIKGICDRCKDKGNKNSSDR